MRMPGSLVRRVRELHPMVADGLLAALVTVLGLPGLFTADEALARLDIRFRSPDALAVLLTLAQTVPLVWRRRAPGSSWPSPAWPPWPTWPSATRPPGPSSGR